MLRRIPYTLLICLVFCVSIFTSQTTWAAGPDESLELLLKPNQGPPVAAPAVGGTKTRRATKVTTIPTTVNCLPPAPAGISKVKASVSGPVQGPIGPISPILPAPKMGQWEMSIQFIFANTRGSIAWPRYSPLFLGILGWENNADFNGDLKLPSYKVWPQFTASYHFRPNWAVRYTVLGNELQGGGWIDTYFLFGNPYNPFILFGQMANTKWIHTYQRVGLVYDAIRTCSAKVSVFADWVHTDERIEANCSFCGPFFNSVWSNSINAAIAGLEFQRAIKTAWNGGTLSWDCKGGGIFLDDTEGWDVEVGARYSIPLNCGRAGYVKGGYRLVQLKKTQYDFLFKSNIEGGFIEGGFIF